MQRILRIELERAAAMGPVTYRTARSLLRRAQLAGVGPAFKAELLFLMEEGQVGRARLSLVARAKEYVASITFASEEAPPKSGRSA